MRHSSVPHPRWGACVPQPLPSPCGAPQHTWQTSQWLHSEAQTLCETGSETSSWTPSAGGSTGAAVLRLGGGPARLLMGPRVSEPQAGLQVAGTQRHHSGASADKRLLGPTGEPQAIAQQALGPVQRAGAGCRPALPHRRDWGPHCTRRAKLTCEPRAAGTPLTLACSLPPRVDLA